MTELSTPPFERSRKAHALILQALQEVGTARNIAAIMGVSESTVSRIKNEHLADTLALICQLGFKVVPFDHACVRRNVWDAVITLVAEAMSNEESIRALLVGDEQ